MTDMIAHDLRVAASRGDILLIARIIEFAEVAHCLLFGKCPEGRFHFIQSILNDRDRHGCTALHFACNLPDAETAFFLIRRGADVDIRDNSGATPIFYACSRDGSMSLVQLLVNNGAEINTEEYNFGKTPFHQACGFMGLDTIKYLALSGANASAKDNSGMTPLHYFAQFKCCHNENAFDTARFLMQQNPLSLIVFDENGNTPVDLCFCETTAKALLEHGKGSIYSWITPFILSIRSRSPESSHSSRYLDSFVKEPLTVPKVPILIQEDSLKLSFSMNPSLDDFQASFALSAFMLLSQSMKNALSFTAVEEIVNEIMSFLSPLDVMQRMPFSNR